LDKNRHDEYDNVEDDGNDDDNDDDDDEIF